jgi:hypothetical protein
MDERIERMNVWINGPYLNGSENGTYFLLHDAWPANKFTSRMKYTAQIAK